MIYQKLKSIKWLEYYFLSPANNSWAETLRNPFYGIKQFLGVKNIDPHTVIDLRIFYKPYKFLSPAYGAKPTRGNAKFVIQYYGKYHWKLFELRRSHPVDALFINGGLTFSFNLVNKYFPWIALNIRFAPNYYFNSGIGWEGTAEKEKTIADLGIKCRVANYKSQCKYNPDVVAEGYWEGHI